MTETELINRIKELEELRTDLIHYGHRIKVDKSIIRYYLSEKQRNILLELLMKEERIKKAMQDKAVKERGE